jgi:tetratricopeptide (TPR) repeat protein
MLTVWAAPLDQPVVSACGPFITFPVFTPAGAPAESSYFSGELGILQPTYARRYLLVAWRTLQGRPLTSQEQRAFTRAPARVSDAVEAWRNARRKLPTPEWRDNVTTGGWISKTFSYYVNCSDSAFFAAAKTLEAKRPASGVADAELVAWTEAQDVVFSNCGRKFEAPPAIPAPLGSDASAAARADRAYQIAAAQFYGGLFDEAEASFNAIARDSSSRWRTWGRYLAARAAIRQATLAAPDADSGLPSLRRAEGILEEVLRDPSLSERHGAARQLHDFVTARTRPTDALVAAAEALSAAEATDSFDRHLGTYEYLLNRYESGDEDGGPSGIGDPRGSSELLDWVLTFQDGGEEAVAHSIDKWRASGSKTWLVVALSLAAANSAQRDELLTAAATIEPASPAYPTVAFHRARLLLLSGRPAEARAVLDRALDSAHLPQSTVNLLKAARLATARAFEEYFDDALRSPVDVFNEEFKTASGSPTLDRDVVDAINQRFPLTLIGRAARSARLPRSVRRELVLAAFTRAVLLDRTEATRDLLPAVAELEPSLANNLRPLRAAADAKALHDEGVLLLVRFPGLRPFVPVGREREPGKLGAIDNLRDNWWCRFAGESVVPYETQYWNRGISDRLERPQQSLYSEPSSVSDPAFLTAEDRRQAEAERQELKQTDTAPNEVGRRVVEWARAHPQDPRVPEALHLVVRATRYGCTNDRTGAVSKDAFTLLHRRYPKSPWAAKTPLWFK